MQWSLIPLLFILCYHGYMYVECDSIIENPSNRTIPGTDHPERIVQAGTGMKLETIMELAPDNDKERTNVDGNIVLVHNPDSDGIHCQDSQESHGNGSPIIPPRVPQNTDIILEKNIFDGYLTSGNTLYFAIAVILLLHIYSSNSSSEE